MQAVLLIGLLQFFKSNSNFFGQGKARPARNIQHALSYVEFSIKF